VVEVVAVAAVVVAEEVEAAVVEVVAVAEGAVVVWEPAEEEAPA
jgi:hypothetical protein